MKILIDAAAAFLYHSTGLGAYATELCRHLSRCSSEIAFFCENDGKLLPLEETLFHSGRTRSSFWERVAARRGESFEGFDLYHQLHNGIGMKKTEGKTIVTIHDMIPCILPQYCGSPYRELFLEQTRTAAEAADAVITVSENSKRDILAFTDVPAERIKVIYEAPKSNCRPLSHKMAADFLYARYGLHGDFFLYVGGFNKRKNVTALIRAYAAVFRNFPKVIPLVIVGKEGGRRRELEELGNRLGIAPFLRFVGFIPDGELPFFYTCCRGLIYPSLYEGFGLPPLEAAACGAAVIVSAVASLPEIMADGALYTDVNDENTLGEQLYALAADDALRKEMADKAYRRSLKFSYQDTALKTLALYENLCR